MIVDSQNSGLSSNLPQNGGSFTIAATAQAFQILSSGVYEHKIAAVVREYMTNALDAHTQAGKEDVPFKVTIPTDLHPYFEVEDFGIGMTMDSAVNIYTQYFNSTKSGTNDVAGGFGLGGKSFLAYTKQFTVRFRKDGEEHTALIYIDANSIPRLDVISSTKTSECNGVKISIPVKRQDFSQFQYEIAFYASFYKVKPLFSLDDFETSYENELFHTDAEDVFVSNVRTYSALGSSQVYVLMGPVPYPVDVHSLNSLGRYNTEFFTNYQGSRENSKAFIKMPIGSIAIAASRESLSLDAKSEEILVERLNRVVEQARKKVIEFVSRKDLHPIEILEQIYTTFPNPVLRSYALEDKENLPAKYNSNYFRIPKLRLIKQQGYGSRAKYVFKPIDSSYANFVLGNSYDRKRPASIKVIEYDKDLRRINQIFSENYGIRYVYNGRLSEQRKERIERILKVNLEIVKYSDLYKAYTSAKKAESPTIVSVRNKYKKSEVVVSGEIVTKLGSTPFTNKKIDLTKDNVYWTIGEHIGYAIDSVRSYLKFNDSNESITLIRKNTKCEKKLESNGIIQINSFLKQFEEDNFDAFKWCCLDVDYRLTKLFVPFVLAESSIIPEKIKDLYTKILKLRKNALESKIRVSGSIWLFPKTRAWVNAVLEELDSELEWFTRAESSKLYDLIRYNYPLMNQLYTVGVSNLMDDSKSLEAMINYIKSVEEKE